MRMPTYWIGEEIQAGDWVRVYSSRYGVWHHGIVRRLHIVATGIAVEIVHNNKEHGVGVADWYDFASGNIVHLHQRAVSLEHAAEVVRRAEANIGKPYALFAQNCEHFASFAFFGKAESASMKTLGWMAAGVVAMAIVAGDSR